MAKKENKPPVQMTSRRLNPQEILNRAQQAKDRFASEKGKADIKIGDALSDCINSLLQTIQQLLNERQQDAQILADRDKKIKELENKIPKPPKVQNSETESAAKNDNTAEEKSE